MPTHTKKRRSKHEAPSIGGRVVLTAMLRKLLQRYFWAFCVFYDPEFFDEDERPHLLIIAEAFQKVTDGLIKKLAISAPPRSGKSYTSSLWCAWMIGRGKDDPNTSIMRNSYGATLAEKFSDDIRAILRNPRFKAVFPDVVLVRGTKEDWAISTAAQSTYFCAGVGGAITGKGCKTAAIADDLIKNLEDALSEVIIEKTWNWYGSTHLSRLEANCPEIHIATRWSKKDPIGMSLSEQEGQWYIVKIAAMTEDNKSFCEKVKTTAEYLELKRLLDDAIWKAEFMQEPIEVEGLLFPAEKLKYFTMKELAKYENPKMRERYATIFGYTDTADEGTDYLSACTIKMIGERCYLTDVVFTQDTIEITQPLVAAMIAKTKQRSHTVESNNGGKGFALELRRLLRSLKATCTMRWRKTTSNKETRILMASGSIKEDIYFRTDYEVGSDYDKFMRNLTSYVKMGKNKNDDAPDMLAGVVDMYTRPGMRFLSTNKAA